MIEEDKLNFANAVLALEGLSKQMATKFGEVFSDIHVGFTVVKRETEMQKFQLSEVALKDLRVQVDELGKLAQEILDTKNQIMSEFDDLKSISVYTKDYEDLLDDFNRMVLNRYEMFLPIVKALAGEFGLTKQISQKGEAFVDLKKYMESPMEYSENFRKSKKRKIRRWIATKLKLGDFYESGRYIKFNERYCSRSKNKWWYK